MVWLITLIFIAVIAVQVPRLVREKLWGELGAFSFLMLLAMVYGYGLVFEISLPNPTHGVELIFRPVGDWLDQALGAPH